MFFFNSSINERTRIKLTLFILICLLFWSYAIGCAVFNVLILLAKLVILFVINENIWDIFLLSMKLQQKVCQSERNFVSTPKMMKNFDRGKSFK